MTNLARGDLNVLLLQRRKHVGCGQSALGHPSGIEPQAHGVFAFSKNKYVADTGDALDGVSYVNIEIIAEEQTVVGAIRGIHTGAEDEAAELFGDDHAGVFYGVWQTAKGLVDAILDIDGGQVYVTGYIEGYGDLAGAVISAGRGDVLHTLHAVDGLFQRDSDGGFDGLGVCPDVATGNYHLRRCEVRKFGYRKRRNGNCATKNNHQGANGGKYGPVDKEINKQTRESAFRGE